MLSEVYEQSCVHDVTCCGCREVDSDGEDVNSDNADDDVNGYRVWYSVDLTVEPGLPEKCLEIYCACQVR